MIKTALSLDVPVAIRYPRAVVSDNQEDARLTDIPIGKAEILREGEDILIIAIGNTVIPSVTASELLSEAGINACVINARFVKPLDIDIIINRTKEIKHIITVEENAVSGGFGSAVLEEIIKFDIEGVKAKMLGLPDTFIEHGPQSLLRKNLGLDAEGIAKEALALMGKKVGLEKNQIY